MTEDTTELATRGGSGEMFDRIAHRYDLLNRLISFGLDRSWRRKLLAALGELRPGDQVLDVATGTADVALDVAAYAEGVTVVGLDPSVGMLEYGRQKIDAKGLSETIKLIEGDAQDMPFETGSFRASCISFGIRNVPDRVKGLSEMARSVEPGGKVVVLELSEPRGGLLAPFARLHIHHIVPFMGALLSGDREYKYLAKSIKNFPPHAEFAALMEEAGLIDVSVEAMTFSVAHLYVGTVPPR